MKKAESMAKKAKSAREIERAKIRADRAHDKAILKAEMIAADAHEKAEIDCDKAVARVKAIHKNIYAALGIANAESFGRRNDA